jgi:uncharacterized protein (DUF1800 family)
MKIGEKKAMRQIEKVIKLTFFIWLLLFILSGCGSTTSSDAVDANITTEVDDNRTITGSETETDSEIDENGTTLTETETTIETGTEDNTTITVTETETDTETEDNTTITATEENNSSEDTTTDENISISGQVIDGEISGAVVFLDLDKDSEFDSTEPSTLTKADGTYTLVLTVENQKHENYLNQTAPLVAYGGKDIRTDEVFEDYLMSMVEGKDNVNITPFTTLIAQSLEEESSTETSKSFQKTETLVPSALAEKIAEIKKNLAELFGLEESILDKNPLELAKEGDNSLLSQSLQLHKSAKTMKKAMKGDVRDLKKSILKSYRSLGNELRKLKRDALKNQDEALLEALDTAMDDSELFDSNLVAEVKEETQKIVVSINEFWKGQEGTLTDNALSDAIKEGEAEIEVGLNPDTTKPVITLLGDSTITLVEGSAYSDAGATASDDVDGDLSSTITVSNPVNINSVGTYIITYNVSDSSGNSAVEVKRTVDVTALPDTVKPVITLIGEPTVILVEGSTYTDAGATALDDVDGDLSSTLQVSNTVNVNQVGSYTVTYDVSDRSGNSAVQVIRTVTINPLPDTTKPIITLSGSPTVTLLQGSVYNDAGATALDDVDGDLTSTITVVNGVNTNSVGNYSVTYDVSDSAGNSAVQVIRTVTVNPQAVVVVPDTSSPILTLVGDSNITLVQGTPYLDAGVIASDDRDGNITSRVQVRNRVDVYQAGTYYITYDVSDSAGNSATQLIRTVTVMPFVESNLSVSRIDALKFLRQASFRSSEEEIFYVMENGYEAWIENQFAMVGDTDSDTDTKYDYLESTLRAMNRYNPTAYPLSVVTDPTTLDEGVIDGQRMDVFRDSVFWDKALNDENQLRQRVTYALSQILVVADDSPAGQALSFRGESVINYYDILYEHSFGNYRELLTDVTHSSAMGYFLTYIGSKAEAPDENYARELTQLFTVGLYELNDDGTKQLNGTNPIPSYDQQHVSDLSKVFTGWSLDDLQGTDPRYGATGKTDSSWVSPLKFFPEYHDSNSTLDLLGSATMTTSPDGSADIENALTILFANHNVAPYISQHLIMRLVTSNPTPAYIARVASVFNNNGAGVKGDLKAVVKAILLDPEARGDIVAPNFGKVDEMIVAMNHFLSQFKAHKSPKVSIRVQVSLGVYESIDIADMYWINPQREFGQTVLGAPSVFNFYSNEFIPSSSYFAQNAVVAPELELQTTPNLIGYSNFLDKILTIKEKYAVLDLDALIFGEIRYPTIEDWAVTAYLGIANEALYLDLTEEYNVFEKALDNEIVANGDFSNMGDGTGANVDRTRAVNALLEYLDDKLFGGTMPQSYKDALLLHTETLDYLANNRNRATRARAIVTTLVRGMITSPLYMVLK